ncbi:MAG: hypothetical protein AAF493_28775, partial [Pseudomonadota bacterium]
EFISDTSTRKFYEILFDVVRRYDTTLTLPFRCDSPRLRRHMSLVAAPMLGDQLKIETWCRRAEHRQAPIPLDILGPRPTATPLLQFCSVCNRARFTNDEWCELERLTHSKRWPSDTPKAVTTTCAECHNDLQRRLARLKQENKVALARLRALRRRG